MVGTYLHKRFWKAGLLAIAVFIGVSSVVYTNYVVKKLAQEERERIQLTVESTRLITELDEDNEALSFLVNITRANHTTPVIITDTFGNITQHRNLDSTRSRDTAYLKAKLSEMKEQNEPLPLRTEYFSHLLYYGDSSTIVMLKYYPYIQLFIIALFIFVSYLAFSSSRRFEQNQVWVGMSKETAHQLGTPLSSLLAWVAYLRESKAGLDPSVVDEIEKDVNRLEQVTERFSKIGSQPVLESMDIRSIIEDSVTYLSKRVSRKVMIYIDENSDPEAIAFVSRALFEWVIENLCKNAVDAMEGQGRIAFLIKNKGETVIIDVRDNGKGIPIYLQKQIFNPGYTTRKRGWGLGLSLSKRIMESYHRGQISVLSSEPGKGSTFRLRLPKNNPFK